MTQNFSGNIELFGSWKSEIGKTLSRLRLWLRRNELFNEPIDKRLFSLQESLKDECLTLAFVGEFSRGKTELINSLFFSEYGQRILPSETGRTTMCPTELYYDKKEKRAYLRLLPIETRLKQTSLTEYKNLSNQWTEVPLMTGSAQEMALALHTVTQTKQVSIAEATLLGFDPSMLEPCDGNDQLVQVPAWRHALVSFPHHLLKQGLRILDTPGLNALGSEPELTLKLLPQVQAIVFLLSADTGVTASDMAVWEEHIQKIEQKDTLGLFAVLNKIDTQWDELSSKKKTDKAIKRMVNTTARQLQLDPRNILPVSAKKGLIAKIRKDKSLLAKSHIDELENILSTNLLENKEKIVFSSVIEETQSLIRSSVQTLEVKFKQLTEQKHSLDSLTGTNKDKIHQLIEENKHAFVEFQKKSLSVKPSQRLLERQAQILLSVIGSKILEKELDIALDELVNSRTTIGLFRQMKQFFIAIRAIMAELSREAELTNKMARSLYKKFSADFNVELVESRPFPIKKLNRELNQIIRQSDKLNKNVFTTFTEHSVAVKRFFSGTVNDVMNFFKSTRKELMNWTETVINPLNQQLRIHHHLITRHQQELNVLRKSENNIGGRIKGVNHLLTEIKMEMDTALELSNNLVNNKLINSEQVEPSNIVALSAASRNK